MYLHAPQTHNNVLLQILFRNYCKIFLLFSAGGLFFGRNNDQTTQKPIIKSPFGTIQVSLAGGQKAPEDPCNPSQNTQQSTGRKPLINIKIPTLFGRGNKQPAVPVECPTAAPVTEIPTLPPKPETHAPAPAPTHAPTYAPTPAPTHAPTLAPKPETPAPTPSPPPKPTAVPHPSTSGQISGSSSTVDPDDDLINSIFGEETAPATTQNNGAGLLDMRLKPTS